MALRDWLTASALGSRLRKGMADLNARYPWNHNDHFHSWVIGNLPAHRRTALDVGCGQGGLLRELAAHVDSVRGIDVDPRMRVEAAARCSDLPGVVVDGTPLEVLEGPFDVVTMIGVLHHLDFELTLRKVRDLLSSGGRLLVVGLAASVTTRDHLWDLAAMVTNPMIGKIKHPWPSAEGQQEPAFPIKDPVMSFDEVLRRSRQILPGATMYHHLAFRYTLQWEKP